MEGVGKPMPSMAWVPVTGRGASLQPDDSPTAFEPRFVENRMADVGALIGEEQMPLAIDGLKQIRIGVLAGLPHQIAHAPSPAFVIGQSHA